MNQIIITYALLIIEEWFAIGFYMHYVRPRLILQSRWVNMKTVAGSSLRYSCREHEVLDGRNRQHVERGIRV